MGAGVALIDYDGDGLWDLYFVNGADLSNVGDAKGPEKSAKRFWNRLYRNLGDWRFEDVTESAGVAGRGYGMGAAVADYDGDGDSDLFVTNFGPDLLYRNDGSGKFTEVSAAAGIAGRGWSAGAAFADFDNDGRLDLFVAQYLDWASRRASPAEKVDRIDSRIAIRGNSAQSRTGFTATSATGALKMSRSGWALQIIPGRALAWP